MAAPENVNPPSPDSFRSEVQRLCDNFGKNLHAYRATSYDEFSLRQDFLDKFLIALGWKVGGTSRAEAWEALRPYLAPGTELKAKYAFEELWETI